MATDQRQSKNVDERTNNHINKDCRNNSSETESSILVTKLFLKLRLQDNYNFDCKLFSYDQLLKNPT